MQLPLQDDFQLLQTKWKSILDPFLAKDFEKQLIIGTPVTTTTNTTSTTFANLSVPVTVQITTTSAARFKIWGSFPTNSTRAGAQNSVLRIFPLSGSPTVLFSQEGFTAAATGTYELTVTPFIYVKLQANTQFLFGLQGKTTSDTLEIPGSQVTNGVALIAEEI